MSAARSVLFTLLLLAHCGGRTQDAPKEDASAFDVPDVPADAHLPLPAPPTSCATPHAGADHSCGAEGAADCCATLEVEGGTFQRFYDVSRRETAGYPATVSSFNLDAHEVTVGRFRAFADAYDDGAKPKPGVGASTHVAGSGWQASWPIAATGAALRTALANEECTGSTHRTWTTAPGANERLPMNCLTWYELFAFCAWDGGRLPTLAEHQYAAAGGAEQRIYPWSIPPSADVVDLSRALYAVDVLKPPALGVVGARPDGRGRWGHYDLSGSVEEFVFDTGAPPAACLDCIQLVDPPTDPPKSRVVLGGGFAEGSEMLPVRHHNYALAEVRDAVNGGRCVRE